MSETQLPPIKLAFIIDGKIVDIVYTNDRLAAIFLSNPTIVEVDDPNLGPGALYDAATGTFTPEVTAN